MTGQERLLGVCSERRLALSSRGAGVLRARQAARRVGTGSKATRLLASDGENISEGTGGTGLSVRALKRSGGRPSSPHTRATESSPCRSAGRPGPCQRVETAAAGREDAPPRARDRRRRRLASASAIVGLSAAYRYEEPPAAAGVSLFFAAVSLLLGRPRGGLRPLSARRAARRPDDDGRRRPGPRDRVALALGVLVASTITGTHIPETFLVVLDRRDLLRAQREGGRSLGRTERPRFLEHAHRRRRPAPREQGHPASGARAAPRRLRRRRPEGDAPRSHGVPVLGTADEIRAIVDPTTCSASSSLLERDASQPARAGRRGARPRRPDRPRAASVRGDGPDRRDALRRGPAARLPPTGRPSRLARATKRAIDLVGRRSRSSSSAPSSCSSPGA